MTHLGQLIVGNQKFVLFKDYTNAERTSSTVLDHLLKSQNEVNITHNAVPDLDFSLSTDKQLLTELNIPSEKSVVILPPASQLFQQFFASEIFKMIHKLKTCPNVKQVFLWLTMANFPEHDHLPEFVEHMSDVVVKLQTKSELELLIRKATGSVTRKQYQWEIKESHVLVNEIKKKKETPVEETPKVKPESLGTFKIELSEKDKIARQNLVLPFEKHLKIEENPTATSSGGKIIYDLDKDDDFDEEDPDDDLDI